MPRSGTSVFGGNARPVLEIHPHSPFVVFYGTPSEAQSVELTGKLVLNNPESMTVKALKLSLSGNRKVSWNTTATVTPQPIVHKSRFLHETQNFFPTHKAHKISAGHHEWDFKFTLPPETDESVEGLGTNWIVYDLHATVDRGYMSKQLSATTHIRVIRTLGRDTVESTPMEQINEDIWASKLAYKITVPQKNYIVGTSIKADFVLIPLRKGVEIATIKMELVEARQLFCDYASRRIGNYHEFTVASKEGTMPENSAHLVPQGIEDGDQLFDESHRFTMSLDLPKSLKKCRQSVDTENIRLTHKLRIYVNLLNPEGHTSQLLVKSQVHLFISPNLPPNEDLSVVVDPTVINSEAMREEMNQNAPPTYGRHQLDELYLDIDPSGFMTPGGLLSLANSGANTPMYGISRSGSYEDLASLDAMAHQDGGGASAAALQHRLHSLSLNQNYRPSRYAPGRLPSSGGNTPQPDAAHSPPTSYFPDMMIRDYDMSALTRTPSYNTAVRSPARPPFSEDLPSYEIATSRPSSPTRTPRSGRSSPSPVGSLDALAEETDRNTRMNSRRASPRREGRLRAPPPASSAPALASASASASALSTATLSSTSTPTAITAASVPSSPPPIPSPERLTVPTTPRSRSTSRSSTKASVSFRSEDTTRASRDPQQNPFRRILRNVQ